MKGWLTWSSTATVCATVSSVALYKARLTELWCANWIFHAAATARSLASGRDPCSRSCNSGLPDRGSRPNCRIKSPPGTFSWCRGMTTSWRNRSARPNVRAKYPQATIIACSVLCVSVSPGPSIVWALAFLSKWSQCSTTERGPCHFFAVSDTSGRACARATLREGQGTGDKGQGTRHKEQGTARRAPDKTTLGLRGLKPALQNPFECLECSLQAG